MGFPSNHQVFKLGFGSKLVHLYQCLVLGVGVGIGIGIENISNRSTPIPIPTPTPRFWFEVGEVRTKPSNFYDDSLILTSDS
jgi:hypothetical protein